MTVDKADVHVSVVVVTSDDILTNIAGTDGTGGKRIKERHTLTTLTAAAATAAAN